MKRILIVILLFSSIDVFAQNFTKEDFEKEIKPLNDKLKYLQSESEKLKSEIRTLNLNLSNTVFKFDSLKAQTNANRDAINKTGKELDSKISTTETSANQKISAVDQSLSKSSLYAIIGVLSAILLSGLIYWLLSKRQASDKTAIFEQLRKTKSSIEESLIKEFGKQTELMDTQLHLLEQQKITLQTTSNIEPDHSLALKLASEINLIERNINLMDSKTKGLKQLVASVGKLKDNLAANGYEIPELLGKQFHQGMKVIVTSSIPDENLEKGSEVITKILIPQVNYNDKMIQTPQIEVSVGY
jgi:hypothetical protein